MKLSSLLFLIAFITVVGASGCKRDASEVVTSNSSVPSEPTRAARPEIVWTVDPVRRVSTQEVKKLYTLFDEMPLKRDSVQIEGDGPDVVYVPLRAASEFLSGGRIGWDAKRRRVKIGNSYAPPKLLLLQGRSYLPGDDLEVWQGVTVRLHRTGSMYDGRAEISMVSISS